MTMVENRPQTLTEAVQLRADSPRGIAFLGETGVAERWSYGRLRDMAGGWAGALAATGVGRGDHVALLGSTTPAFAAALFGAWTLGAVVVPLAIPTRMPPPDVLVAGLRAKTGDADVSLVAVDDRVASFPGVDTLAPDVVSFSDLGSRAREHRPADVAPSDLALIQYTSGSTGSPKGVMLSHGALVGHAWAAQERGRMTPEDVVVGWLPLFHDFGLIGLTLWPLLLDMSTHLMAPETFIASPRRWMEAMADHGGTITAAPNFAYGLAARTLRNADRTLDLSRVRIAANGAEPVDAQTMADFADAGRAHGLRPGSRFPVYGLAEATLGVTTVHPLTDMRVVGADPEALIEGRLVDAGATGRALVGVGTPIPGVEIELRDGTGAAVEAGRIGEIHVRSAFAMDGYYGDEAATRATFADDWFRTGDLGASSDGELFVTGRLDDLIIVAGRNLYPEDAERAAHAIQGVRRGNAVAFGTLGSRREGIVVVAETRLAGDQAGATARAVSSAVRRSMGVSVEHVLLLSPGALPKTPSGKLQRSRTRELYERGDLEAATVASAGRRA